MYYYKLCALDNGLLGFYRCAYSKRIVLICDELNNAAYLHPDDVGRTNSIPFERDEYVPDLGCVVLYSDGRGNAGWATKEEIIEAGWEKYIMGERTPDYNSIVPLRKPKNKAIKKES